MAKFSKITDDEKYDLLVKYQKRMSKEVQSKFSQKDYDYLDAVIQHKAKVTGSNNFPLLNGNKIKSSLGITDWNDAKLPNNATLIVQGLKIGYAKDTMSAATTELKRLYSSLQAPVDSAIFHARFILKQFNKTLIDLPMSQFFSEAVNDELNGSLANVFVLNNPIIIAADTETEMYLDFPDGLAVDDAAISHFLSTDLFGEITHLK